MKERFRSLLKYFLVVFLGLVLIVSFSAFFTAQERDEGINQGFLPEDINLTKESNWDGFYGQQRCMAFSNNYAFIGGDYDFGLLVVEVSFFAIPTIVDTYYFPEGNESNVEDIVVSNQGDYIFCGSSNIIVFHFDNTTNTLTKITEYSSPSVYSMVLNDNTLYFTDYNDKLHILNVTNPASPSFLGEYTSPYNNINDCDYSDNKIFLASRFHGVVVVNVTDPTSPSYLTDYSYDRTYGLKVNNNQLYVTGQQYGLYLTNITDINNPISYNYTTLHDAINVFYLDDIAFVAEGDAVELIDVSDFTTPTQMSYFNATNPGFILEVHCDRNFVYYVDLSRGFEVYDCVDPYNPVYGSALPIHGYAYDFIIDGTHGYLSSNYSIVVLDLINPANPTPIAYYNSELSIIKILIHNDNIFILSLFGTVEILTSDYPLTLVSSYNTTYNCLDMCISDNSLYLATTNGFEIIDITDINSPVKLDEYVTNEVDEIFVSSNYLFTSYMDKVIVYDVTIGSISKMNEYTVSTGHIYGFYYTLGRVITTGDTTLHVLNVTNPMQIDELGTFGLVDHCEEIFVKASVCFTFEGSYGIRILNLTEPGSISVIDNLTLSGVFVPKIFATDNLLCFTLFDLGVDIYSFDIDFTPTITPTPTTNTPTGNGAPQRSLLWIGIGTTAGILAGVTPVLIVVSARRIRTKKELMMREAAISKFYSCNSCGYPVNKETTMCEDCGKEVVRCVVCKLPISLGDAIGQCSLCEGKGHLSHMQDWVSKQKKCPQCLQEIPLDSIVQIIEDKKKK